MLVFLEKQGPSDPWLLFFCLVQQKYERLQVSSRSTKTSVVYLSENNAARSKYG